MAPLHPIWKIGLFERIKENNSELAECTECKAKKQSKYQFKLSDRSISSLLFHLKSEKHKNSEYKTKFDELMKTVKATTQKGNEVFSGKIENFVLRSSGRLSRLDKVIINLICCNNLSFNLINSPQFRALCKPWNEQLKDESHYRKLLPVAYETVKDKIKAELQNFDSISCTTDIWSGPNQGFLSLTVEGITNKWERARHILAIQPFPGTHTGRRVAEMLAEIIDRWECGNKIYSFTTDGGTNIKKAFTEENENGIILPFYRSNCAAHLLDRAVKYSFGEREGAISELFASCRRIVSGVKHSIKALAELQDAQTKEGLPQHKLLQEIAVRWNSSLIMIRRLSEQRDAIDRIAFGQRKFELTLQDGEWRLLKALERLLTPLEEASLYFCKSPISTQIPFSKALISQIRQMDLRVECENGNWQGISEVEEMRARLLAAIEERFVHLEKEKLHALSTFLDPRYKQFFATDNDHFTMKVKFWLLEEQKHFGDDVELFESDRIEDESLFIAPSLPKKQRTFLDSLSEIASTSKISVQAQKESTFDGEFQRYCSADLIGQELDPLDGLVENK